MIYLLSGEDHFAKEQKIEAIKQSILTTENSRQFDYELLYGNKLNSELLKKTLVALPATATQRVVLIRAVHKLNTHNKELILECVEQEPEHLILILDADEMDARSAFFKKLIAQVKVVRFGQRKKKNVFDMTKVMGAGNMEQTLKILHELMDEGSHPLQLMGGLTWYWGKERNRVSSEKFQHGLRCLQEADLNIKRSRLKPQEAMEVLVVKLMEN
ncbi:hypothetical protein MNBD_UNCLBAC01-79 [hydrothermal vent metagenome]|uniref:DNA polymerase III subunit delta n=1 Tax=hydrothermal vent metagenome TaxID=652676 RepID=A0A3B1DKF5_9ZZZZ